MPYTKTTWVNNTAPALSATNLNKLTDELESLAATQGVSHSLPNWVNGAVPALTDATPWNEMDRVLAAVSNSLGVNYVRTTWESGWIPARSAGRLNALEEAARAARAAYEVPPPPPVGDPIPANGIITSGGTYSGSFTGTIVIQTTAPVIITQATLTNLSGDPLIDALINGVDITLDHVTAIGGQSWQTSGRLMWTFDHQQVTMRNCTITNTRGLNISRGKPGSTVLITKNKHHNIQGNGASPVGNFVQFNETQNSTSVEVSWNQITNEPGISNAEDTVSMFKVANARVHDNYFEHHSNPNNGYNEGTQGTITIEAGDGSLPHPHDNEVWNNVMVDCRAAIGIYHGYNNFVHHNKVVQDGYLPDGVTRNLGGWEAMYIATNAGANNHMHDNVVGFINRDGNRNDGSLYGAPEGHDAEWAKNTHLPDPITRQMELDEWPIWLAKLQANGITIGA